MNPSLPYGAARQATNMMDRLMSLDPNNAWLKSNCPVGQHHGDWLGRAGQNALRLVLIAWFAVVLFLGGSHAQSIDQVLEEIGVTGSILDVPPFDIITVTSEHGGKSVQVNLLDLPDRRVPTSPKPTEKLRCVLNLFPGRLYEIQWKDIAKIILWEELVLDRAKKLLADKDYAEAFEHLVYLRDNYPQSSNVQALHQEFLFSSARDMAASGDLPHTLAALEELQRRFPNFRTADVQTAISSVASKLIDDLFARNELGVARSMILRLDREYKGKLPAVDKAKARFQELAESFRAKATEYRQAGDYGRARQSAVRMLEIEPDLEGGKEFLNELIKEFPLIRVGVFQRASKPDTAALADWPAFRLGQLTATPVFSFRSTGPEGGIYPFSYGNAVQSDDRLQLDLTLQNVDSPSVPDSLFLSQALLQRANVKSPLYVPGWASIFESVSVLGPERLRIRLRQPHVLPQAMMQWQLPNQGEQSFNRAAYQLKSEDEERKRFEWIGDVETADYQPKEIQEVYYEDPKQAINDLLKGELEFIDRLFPADARRLGGYRYIKTEPYALPMVHMLVPRGKGPYFEDREFRRALLYAINRSAILSDEILGGSPSPVDRLISGPFPAGASETDALAYAYNLSVEEPPYDPRTATVLVMLSQANQASRAAKKKEPAPKLPVIRLGVPNFEAARVAGQAILQAWKIIGVDGKLVVYDELPKMNDDSIDILYMSAALWEPVTDAERLFGVGGPAESNNQYIVQALGKLNAARNWREVREGCQDLHSLVAAHLPILPLWQVSETFAYRTEIQGVAKRPIGLYQDVQKWRIQVR